MYPPLPRLNWVERGIVTIAALALVGGILYEFGAFGGSPGSRERAQQMSEFALIDRGKDMAAARLRDPDSAQFRSVRFSDRRGPTVCGEINGRNAFGAYAGFQRFVSGGSPGTTFLEGDAQDFGDVWARLC